MQAEKTYKTKSNLSYAGESTPKRVTSGEDHLRGLAPGQHSSEKTSQRWGAVGDTVFDLADPKFEPPTFRTYSIALTAELSGRLSLKSFQYKTMLGSD